VKFYHFHSDGKTVKEISPERYLVLLNRGEKSKHRVSTLVKVIKSEIFVRHGHNYVWLKKRQMRQVLEETPQFPVEPQKHETQQNNK
jgi:UDP-N-acetylenolpyruvoylglucosamine reductase